MNTVSHPKADARCIQPTTDSSTIVVREIPTLSEVMALIRQESQDRPQRYLDQVHVPGGGE